ncbi:MAG: hypothetical protein AABX89_01590 [Candidatus Thermoplasmatota archaeon]
MHPRWLAPAVLALLFVSGCLGAANDEPSSSGSPANGAPEPVVPPQPDFDFSTVIQPDHGAHEVAALHTAGHGLTQVGYTSIQELLPLGVRGSITQVDVQGDWAVVSGMEGGLAFVLVDLSDPTDPVATSWYPSAADGWTARLSEDGNYVFYGCQMLGATGDVTATVRGTCEDPTAIHAPSTSNPAGVVVVDVRDKTNPKFVDFLATGGSHNIQYAFIGGVDTIFTSAVTILTFDRTAGELTQVADVPGRHDATLARHPTTGQWLLLTGTGELSIYNVDNPADPQMLFEGTSDMGWTGWHEQTVVPQLVDGKFVVVLAGESFVGTGDLTGAEGSSLPDTIFIADITDPANPTLLGSWQPPLDPRLPWVSYLYSVHEIAATPTGQVAIAWYHGGVWVLDISTEERQISPVTLAVFQPHEEMTALPPSTFAQVPVPVVPFVWGTGWHRSGHLIVPDMHTGLYVLEPAWGLHPGGEGGA